MAPGWNLLPKLNNDWHALVDHFRIALGIPDMEYHRGVVREFLARPENSRNRKTRSRKARTHQQALGLLQAITLNGESRADYCRRTGLDPARATRLLVHLYQKEPKLRDVISAHSTGTSKHFRQQQFRVRYHIRNGDGNSTCTFNPDQHGRCG